MTHQNFGVSDFGDEFDLVLHKTVADLRDPPKVPQSETPKHFHVSERAKLRTKGYPLSKTEGFVND